MIISDADTAAIITAIGVVLAAAIAAVAGVLVHHSKRMSRMEQREKSYWLYTRQLVDHIYRGLPPPPPKPPAGLFEEPTDD